MSSGARPLVQQVLAYSVSVAERSTRIVQSILRTGDLGIVEKQGANDLQTEADRSVQRCIVANLSRQFPRMTVIGEEDEPLGPIPDDWRVTAANQHAEQLTCPAHLADITEDEIVVWVDPLDGTKEFTEGLVEHVTILIGISARGSPVAGVVAQPYYNSSSSCGSQHDEGRGRVVYALAGGEVVGLAPGQLQLPPRAADTAGVVTTTRSHSTGTVKDTLQAMKPDKVLAVGGAGHKVLLLLEGRAHAYVFPTPGCKKWDTCAPEAVLKAAGGQLTDVLGVQLQYHAQVQHVNSSGVLATAPGVPLDWYVRHVPEHVVKRLTRDPAAGQ